ncbi:MAG TPA: hypothetical protein VHV26_16085 [Rhizomicrobium sp.]|jgi:hypothetical protein|nr:hypothetical protein [Rhizomicrobium sp.]
MRGLVIAIAAFGLLSGCAVYDVGSTAVGAATSVASTAVGVAGDVAGGVIGAVGGSADPATGKSK